MLLQIGLEVLDDRSGIANDLCVNNLDAIKLSGRELPVAPMIRLRGAAGGGRECQTRQNVEDLHYK